MIALVDSNGMEIIRAAPGTHAARLFDELAVDDRLTINGTMHKVIGRAYVHLHATMRVNGSGATVDNERTTVTVAVCRRRQGDRTRLVIVNGIVSRPRLAPGAP